MWRQIEKFAEIKSQFDKENCIKLKHVLQDRDSAIYIMEIGLKIKIRFAHSL